VFQGSLAGKMRFVGLSSLVFGLFALPITLLTVLFVFRDRLPAGFREYEVEAWVGSSGSWPINQPPDPP
jgi:hypothetical protein